MGRRPKTYIPFEQKTEIHPWIAHPIIPSKPRSLILGSFPPNKFTTHRERLSQCDMDFFYGSKENAFWELFLETMDLNLKLPDELINLKGWLVDNQWTVTDIVKESQRKKDTAFDADLIVVKWNIEAIKAIFRDNSIDNLFFTSQWVKEKFDVFIKPFLENVLFENLNQTILLSPSRNGLRKAKLAKFTTHKCKEDETAEQYRKRYYKLVLKTNITADPGIAKVGY